MRKEEENPPNSLSLSSNFVFRFASHSSADPCPYSCEEKEENYAQRKNPGGGKKRGAVFFFRFFFVFFSPAERRFFYTTDRNLDIDFAKLQAAATQGADLAPRAYWRGFALASGPHRKGKVTRLRALGFGERGEQRRTKESRAVELAGVGMRRSPAALAATLLSLIFVSQARERELETIQDRCLWRGSTKASITTVERGGKEREEKTDSFVRSTACSSTFLAASPVKKIKKPTKKN